MSDGADPPRLSRDSGSAVERRLGALVEGSRGDVGTDEQLAQLEARLLSLIGPPGTGGPPAPSGGGSAAATGVTGALKAAGLMY